MTFKGYVKEALLRSGYEVRRRDPDQLGFDAFKDMRRLTPANGATMLFDVGANIGQTVDAFRKHFFSSDDSRL
jgi:hypothetical protein